MAGTVFAGGGVSNTHIRSNDSSLTTPAISKVLRTPELSGDGLSRVTKSTVSGTGGLSRVVHRFEATEYAGTPNLEIRYAGGSNRYVISSSVSSDFEVTGIFRISASTNLQILTGAKNTTFTTVATSTHIRDNTSASGSTVIIDPTSGELFRSTSSIKYKTNVNTLTNQECHDIVLKLRPVSFKDKKSGQANVGLIAEEVHKVDPRVVIYGKNQEPEGLAYDKMVAYLVGAVQKLTAELEAVKASIS